MPPTLYPQEHLAGEQGGMQSVQAGCTVEKALTGFFASSAAGPSGSDSHLLFTEGNCALEAPRDMILAVG